MERLSTNGIQDGNRMNHTVQTNHDVRFNFETYIFDLDGTLLSTLEDLAASCNYALRTHGMPERTLEEVRLFVGNGVKKLMERAIPEGLLNPKFEDTYQTFRKHYMTHNLDSTKPYEGVMEMLESLKGRGKKIAVVSNKFYDATQAYASISLEIW